MNNVRFSSGILAEDLNHVANAKEMRFGEAISRELLLQMRHLKVYVIGEVPAADLSACVDQWMEERPREQLISYLEVKVHGTVWYLDMRVCQRQ
ncbi:Protein CBG25167 [Caenorhabditis briggsae]|uniref:Protein CBG25167 n=1 Tax=Caenorhabditis briggsae TaxID=6238 RepID=B6IEL8_CAEBR|nr:Protein CBG25167 [Caenorhabditis briggsae]CAR98348.1 Protein CBG25167 [Caenorhabditis briggsae]